MLLQFSGCYDAKENSVAVSMRSKVIELLEKYMNDNKKQILSEIVTAPFIKYPVIFSNYFKIQGYIILINMADT